jgi:hypothetical protein
VDKEGIGIEVEEEQRIDDGVGVVGLSFVGVFLGKKR